MLYQAESTYIWTFLFAGKAAQPHKAWKESWFLFEEVTALVEERDVYNNDLELVSFFWNHEHKVRPFKLYHSPTNCNKLDLLLPSLRDIFLLTKSFFTKSLLNLEPCEIRVTEARNTKRKVQSFKLDVYFSRSISKLN